MNGNYTLRDFLAYFITGAYVVSLVLLLDSLKITSLISWPNENPFLIEGNWAVLTAIGLPLIYVLGHLVASLDYILIHGFFKLVKKIKVENSSRNRLVDMIFGYRISNRIDKHKEELLNALPKEEAAEKAFWKIFSVLQTQNDFGVVEYRYVLYDLMKHLYLVSLIASITLLFSGEVVLFVWFISATFLFRQRARHMAKIFVENILNIQSISKKDEMKFDQ